MTDPLIAALELLADPTMLHKHRDPKHPDLGGEVLVRCALAADALAQHAAKAGDGGDWVLVPREPGRCELDDSGFLLTFVRALHGNVAEEDCPSGWSDFSDEQRTRIQNAYRAMLAAAPSPPTPSASDPKCFECGGDLTIICLACNPEIVPSPPAGDEVEAVARAILSSLWSPASARVEWTPAKIEVEKVQAGLIAKAAIQALDRVRARAVWFIRAEAAIAALSAIAREE